MCCLCCVSSLAGKSCSPLCSLIWLAVLRHKDVGCLCCAITNSSLCISISFCAHACCIVINISCVPTWHLAAPRLRTHQVSLVVFLVYTDVSSIMVDDAHRLFPLFACATKRLSSLRSPFMFMYIYHRPTVFVSMLDRRVVYVPPRQRRPLCLYSTSHHTHYSCFNNQRCLRSQIFVTY